MSLFAISFRIHYDNTYDERYTSVNEVIRAQRTGTYWEETTSFILLECNKNSTQLADVIYQNSKFSADKDLLLVINLDQNGYKLLGKSTDDDIKKLMAARKLVVAT